MESLRKYYKLKIATEVKHGWKSTKIKPCANCGRNLRIQAYWLKNKNYKNSYCDRKCMGEGRSRGGNKELKGGWADKRWGYWIISINNKKIYRHRAVMEQMLKRKLNPGEQVHHINGKPGDDRPENLMLVDYRHHPSEKDRKIRTLQARIRELEKENEILREK